MGLKHGRDENNKDEEKILKANRRICNMNRWAMKNIAIAIACFGPRFSASNLKDIYSGRWNVELLESRRLKKIRSCPTCGNLCEGEASFFVGIEYFFNSINISGCSQIESQVVFDCRSHDLLKNKINSSVEFQTTQVQVRFWVRHLREHCAPLYSLNQSVQYLFQMHRKSFWQTLH